MLVYVKASVNYNQTVSEVKGSNLRFGSGLPPQVRGKLHMSCSNLSSTFTRAAGQRKRIQVGF